MLSHTKSEVWLQCIALHNMRFQSKVLGAWIDEQILCECYGIICTLLLTMLLAEANTSKQTFAVSHVDSGEHAETCAQAELLCF